MTEINLSFQNSRHCSPGTFSDLPHENVFEGTGRQSSSAISPIQFEPDSLEEIAELGVIPCYHQACGQWRELAV